MHPVIRKLSVFTAFSREEESAIELALGNIVELPEHQVLAREDEPPGNVLFLLDGFAYRHKLLDDGSRQIIAFLLPGDVCDVGVTLLERRDHSISTMSQCEVAKVSDPALQHLTQQYPRVAAAMQWAVLVDEAITREWVLNIGQRKALPRAAHLFCELYFRMKAIGRGEGLNFEMPLTQEELGDTLGISVVHTNRTLQHLRQRKLIAFGDNRVTILNVEELQSLADFDPNYLHLEARYQARA